MSKQERRKGLDKSVCDSEVERSHCQCISARRFTGLELQPDTESIVEEVLKLKSRIRQVHVPNGWDHRHA